MVVFSRLSNGIYVDRGWRKVRQLMAELMVYYFGDFMTFYDSDLWLYRNVDFRVKSMADPSSPNF